MKPWKYIVAIWMTAVVIGGILIKIPMIPILEQTARNIFFHVPMWMAMFSMFTVSFVYSIRYLNSPNLSFDIKAESAAKVGVVFGFCGLLTGSLWARFTWGTWWTVLFLFIYGNIFIGVGVPVWQIGAMFPLFGSPQPSSLFGVPIQQPINLNIPSLQHSHSATRNPNQHGSPQWGHTQGTLSIVGRGVKAVF